MRRTHVNAGSAVGILQQILQTCQLAALLEKELPVLVPPLKTAIR